MSVVGIIILLVEVKDHAFSDSSLQVEEELVKHPFSTDLKLEMIALSLKCEKTPKVGIVCTACAFLSERDVQF